MSQSLLELSFIMVSLFKSIWVQWVTAGILLGVGFVYPTLWILGLIGGAYCVYLVLQAQSKKQLYLGAWLTWTIKALVVSVWVWSTYPINSLGFDLGKGQIILIAGCWIVSSISLGFGGVFFAWCTRVGSKFITNKFVLFGLCIPTVWVVAEMVGSLLFSISMIGPGGNINTSFSFGYVGFLFAEHPTVLLLAQLGGVYSLSFVFTLVTSGLIYLTQQNTKKCHQTAAAVLVIIFLTSFTYSNKTVTKNDEGYSVIVVDTKFPNSLIFEENGQSLMGEELHIAVTRALETVPNYIILPEDSRFFNQRQHPALARALFQFQHQDPDTIIVDSGRVETEVGSVLQTFVYNGIEDEVEQSHKRYLVPQGEFIPSLYFGILELFGYGEAAQAVANDMAYVVGPLTSQAKASALTPGVLFCFESVDPLGVRKILRERPQVPFIAHPISHGWFHESEIFEQQLDSMLQVQAVWNNQYIVSAGGNVAGTVYTPTGAIQNPTTVEVGKYWTVREVIIPKRN